MAKGIDKDGKVVGANQGGFLVIRQPWPSMLRGATTCDIKNSSGARFQDAILQVMGRDATRKAVFV